MIDVLVECQHVLFQHIIDPHNMEESMDVTVNNPLSQDQEVSNHRCYVYCIAGEFGEFGKSSDLPN